MTFDLGYSIQILPILLRAAEVTVLATLAGMGCALVGGLALALGRLSPVAPLRALVALYIELFRSTPLLVQLFLVFYVLPAYGVALSPFVAGILGLGLYYSAYIAEVYRAGIEAVPRGQWEVAWSLTLSPGDTWVRIVLPQAIPPIIPALGNNLISMFKDTPLLATISVTELLGAALREAGFTFRYFEPLTLVGLIFLAVSYPSALLLERLEHRFASH